MMSIICIANFLNLLEQKDIFNHQRKFESEPVTNKIKEFTLQTSQNLIFLHVKYLVNFTKKSNGDLTKKQLQLHSVEDTLT